MKYFGGCDVGSTYTKTVILDENGAIVAANTIKSKINSAQSARQGWIRRSRMPVRRRFPI